MFTRTVVVFLSFCLMSAPVQALSLEATSVPSTEIHSPDFWQEFDISFWQTLPFAALWGHIIDRQISPSTSPHWEIVMGISTVLSAANAWRHANKVTDKAPKE